MHVEEAAAAKDATPAPEIVTAAAMGVDAVSSS